MGSNDVEFLRQPHILEKKEYGNLSDKFFKFLVDLSTKRPELANQIFDYMGQATNCFSLRGIQEIIASFQTQTGEYMLVEADAFSPMTQAQEFSPLTAEQLNQYEQ